MGDFNYLTIDWGSWRTRGDNTATDEYLLIENLQENYLFQHADKPTRWRGTDEPHTLDLILTNEESMVDEIIYESPLGKSDHCILYFDFLCYCEIESRKKTKKYYEADYQKINEEINQIDCAAEFKQYKNINTMWSAFQTKIRSIEEKYVPKKTFVVSSKTRSRILVDASTFSEIRRYLATKDPTVQLEYNRVRNQVKRDMRKLRKKFEQKSKSKSNPKEI